MIMYLKWKIQDVRKKNGEPIKGLKLAAAIMKVFRRFSTHLCVERKLKNYIRSLTRKNDALKSEVFQFILRLWFFKSTYLAERLPLYFESF